MSDVRRQLERLLYRHQYAPTIPAALDKWRGETDALLTALTAEFEAAVAVAEAALNHRAADKASSKRLTAGNLYALDRTEDRLTKALSDYRARKEAAK